MKYSKEVSEQVIRNIELIEQSYKVIEEVEDVILNSMSKTCSNHLEERLPNLIGDCDFKDGLTKFSVKEWCTEESKPLANYVIGYDENKQTEEVDIQHYLPHLLGSNVGTACYQIRFSLDNGQLNIKKSVYKKFLIEAFDKEPKFQAQGFRLSDDGLSIVYEFIMDTDLLASEYPDFFDAFSPFTDALDCLIDMHPLFEELVNRIKKQIT